MFQSFAIDPASPAYRAPFNTVGHVRSLAGPADRTIVAPNVDTLYSYAWLDLRAEPVILSIPSFENNYVSLHVRKDPMAAPARFASGVMRYTTTFPRDIP